MIAHRDVAEDLARRVARLVETRERAHSDTSLPLIARCVTV